MGTVLQIFQHCLHKIGRMYLYLILLVLQYNLLVRSCIKSQTNLLEKSRASLILTAFTFSSEQVNCQWSVICVFNLPDIWLTVFFNRISWDHHRNIWNNLTRSVFSASVTTSRKALWSIRRSFKLRQEYPFRCFLFVYFAAHISQQIASADPRTVLFGIILFLFHSVSSEEVFNSKYCLMHSYGFSAMNCSLGHCFWDLLGINNKKTRSVSR